MEIKKDELAKMAKARGLDIAEEMLEKGAKAMAHLILDVLGKMADESKNPYDDMIKVALEGKLREMADKIEVSL